MPPSNILLVEGRDDEHVLYSLLRHHRVPTEFVVRSKDGINSLLDTLDVELLASDLRHLGVVIDADTDLESRWQSIRNVLMTAGYTLLPDMPDPLGTVIEEEGRPTVGIWIMPDNVISGMLEHFVGFLVRDSDELWEQAQRVVDDIPIDHCRFVESHRAKAHVHTWLAWQQDPGTPLGLAITKRYLDADAEHAQRLIAWIRRLFAL